MILFKTSLTNHRTQDLQFSLLLFKLNPLMRGGNKKVTHT